MKQTGAYIPLNEGRCIQCLTIASDRESKVNALWQVSWLFRLCSPSRPDLIGAMAYLNKVDLEWIETELQLRDSP